MHCKVMVRVRSKIRIVLFCLLPTVVLSGCEDPFWARMEPLIATATVDLGVPGSMQEQQQEMPSAMDITALGGVVQGGRFPERAEDADRGWDFAVRRRNGQLTLVPSNALGVQSRAGFSPALDGQTFEGLREVPAGVRFDSENPIPVRIGAVHVARSRDFAAGFFGTCVQYAKLQVVEADVAAGTVRIQIATNERCGDTRLVPTGS
jgi:hypothetical protein